MATPLTHPVIPLAAGNLLLDNRGGKILYQRAAGAVRTNFISCF